MSPKYAILLGNYFSNITNAFSGLNFDQNMSEIIFPGMVILWHGISKVLWYDAHQAHKSGFYHASFFFPFWLLDILGGGGLEPTPPTHIMTYLHHYWSDHDNIQGTQSWDVEKAFLKRKCLLIVCISMICRPSFPKIIEKLQNFRQNYTIIFKNPENCQIIAPNML